MTKRKWVKRFLGISGVLFLLLNIIACFHAYHFTHFTDKDVVKTKESKDLSVLEKATIVLTGVNNPRPKNIKTPSLPFKTITLQPSGGKKTELWSIQTPKQAKGTVILFHGYCSSKSKMLDKAEVFLELGYNTILVDFMGSGGSEGNQTTIGFYEAEQVKYCFEYLKKQGEKNIYLFGTSMGAVAILKSCHDYGIKAKGLMLECPFGTMYETVSIRFENLGVPKYPLVHLLVFWGGVQNGFWAFSHKPTKYAKKVHTKTLLLYGEKDNRVTRAEIDAIYNNIPTTQKSIVTYPLAGHENYLLKYNVKWTEDIKAFLE
jgi:uncharacterized protein